MAPIMALKAATPFLGCTTGFRARCRGTQASARTKFMAPQAYSITLKTPDGEQKVECMGEGAVSSMIKGAGPRAGFCSPVPSVAADTPASHIHTRICIRRSLLKLPSGLRRSSRFCVFNYRSTSW